LARPRVTGRKAPPAVARRDFPFDYLLDVQRLNSKTFRLLACPSLPVDHATARDHALFNGSTGALQQIDPQAALAATHDMN